MFSFLIYDFELSQNLKILSFLIGTTYPLLLFIGKISLKLPSQGYNSSCFMFVLVVFAVYRYEGLVRLTILHITPKPLKMLSTKILRLLNFDVLFSEMYIQHQTRFFANVWGNIWKIFFFSRNVLQCDFWRDIIAKCNGFKS